MNPWESFATAFLVVSVFLGLRWVVRREVAPDPHDEDLDGDECPWEEFRKEVDRGRPRS